MPNVSYINIFDIWWFDCWYRCVFLLLAVYTLWNIIQHVIFIITTHILLHMYMI